jgi:hypothetical protein
MYSAFVHRRIIMNLIGLRNRGVDWPMVKYSGHVAVWGLVHLYRNRLN